MEAPHCGKHGHFAEGCPACARAKAAFEPYPVRRNAEPTRSFGFKDDLTAEKLRALNPKLTNLYADDQEFSLSLMVMRFLKKLIWPF